MNKTYKLIGLLSILAMVLAVTPVTLADNINTSLTRDATGAGSAPVVKVKWEMLAPYTNESRWGKDDDPTTDRAQFKAPGEWNGVKTYSICAIVTDHDSLQNADIAGVYADIYYPTGIAFHKLSDNPDIGSEGCGNQRGTENTLNKLSKMTGYRMFCETIKNNYENLPEFNTGYYDGLQIYSRAGMYEEICAQDGELMEEEAYVYCDDKELSYEDPAGSYKVVVMAQDKSTKSGTLTNYFSYLPLTAFKVDFNSVNYGNVKWNTEQGVSGDLNFEDTGTSLRPTVRNTGNTRLNMGVQQNDMGLGKRDSSIWNVQYRARVGNNSADWSTYYYPNEATPKWLEDILDLSQVNKMDFSILVTKYPKEDTNWIGTMTLSAKQADFRQCP